MVTPTALQTKAKIVTIAIRHRWTGCCHSCSPTSNHASWFVGTPLPAVLNFLDIAEPFPISSPLCNFICLGLSSPHCHLAEANFSLWSQLKWHLLWEVSPKSPNLN